jgi:hypothetical protein
MKRVTLVFFVFLICIFPVFAESKLVPLHHLYHFSSADSFYTANEYEKDIFQSMDYIYLDVEGYVFSEQVVGTVPLYRMWNKEEEDHFYTISEDEKDSLQDAYEKDGKGWKYEKVEGYVYSEKVPGTVPLYRLWKAQDADHAYTIDQDELENYLAEGYKSEGKFAGYVYFEDADYYCGDGFVNVELGEECEPSAYSDCRQDCLFSSSYYYEESSGDSPFSDSGFAKFLGVFRSFFS